MCGLQCQECGSAVDRCHLARASLKPSASLSRPSWSWAMHWRIAARQFALIMRALMVLNLASSSELASLFKLFVQSCSQCHRFSRVLQAGGLIQISVTATSLSMNKHSVGIYASLRRLVDFLS